VGENFYLENAEESFSEGLDKDFFSRCVEREHRGFGENAGIFGVSEISFLSFGFL